MTPQDIREKTFEKAMFGGYDMAAVQNYQEEVATELANAQKEVRAQGHDEGAGR